MTGIAIVPTGTANIASVKAALRRLGASPVDAMGPDDVASAEQVVVPGVGAFGAAMSTIDSLGMREVLRERIEAGRPTLAVCVGMQLLCDSSTETPGSVGLGVVKQVVQRFSESVRVPHLGWNRVEPGTDSAHLEPGWAYFANSYRITSLPDGWAGATTDYDGEFVAAMERGAVLALQFHPELSGDWGSGILRRWLTATGAAS
jgi:imidazole glycerol phosphate synthase glutamine amidotransferase subunit